MKNLNKKTNWALTLSAVSLIIVVAIIGLWIFKSQEIAVITLDTFVGVIVALLAIIVTIVLGWQIFNIFELRQKMEEMNELKLQFNKQSGSIEELATKTEHRMFLTWGEEAKNNKKYGTAIYYFVISLSHSLKLSNPININKLLMGMEFCNSKMVNKCPMTPEEYGKLLFANEVIRTSFIYSIIKKEYSTVYDSYIQKVEQKQQ